MTVKEFDKMFDDGEEDIIEHLDLSSIKRVSDDTRFVNIECPLWLYEGLDREAQNIGVNLQSMIKVWLAEKITAK
ncbi:hypothetical protein FACS1894208_10600 [Clostridia bacterium]|nr:hypothetical protein FACS1894208_10600 [Clostridia bacterium]